MDFKCYPIENCSESELVQVTGQIGSISKITSGHLKEALLLDCNFILILFNNILHKKFKPIILFVLHFVKFQKYMSTNFENIVKINRKVYLQKKMEKKHFNKISCYSF